jgi:hypothetical protein
MFLLGEAGDYGTPFRAALDGIVAILARSKPTHLQLPPYEDGEDFVEGQLRFGGAHLRVYYEHSLGFLALVSESSSLLDEIKALTRSDTLVRSD